MPGTSRRTASTKAPKTPPAAGPERPDPAPAEESTPPEHPVAATTTPAAEATRTAETEPDTVVVRLPFLTVSLSRPAARPAEPSGGAAPAEPVSAAGSSGVQRLLFYGGVAALSVVGAVEWPVAAAIAAGTYVATRTRALGRAPGE
jgi:hypothetical protein